MVIVVLKDIAKTGSILGIPRNGSVVENGIKLGRRVKLTSASTPLFETGVAELVATKAGHVNTSVLAFNNRSTLGADLPVLLIDKTRHDQVQVMLTGFARVPNFLQELIVFGKVLLRVGETQEGVWNRDLATANWNEFPIRESGPAKVLKTVTTVAMLARENKLSGPLFKAADAFPAVPGQHPARNFFLVSGTLFHLK